MTAWELVPVTKRMIICAGVQGEICIKCTRVLMGLTDGDDGIDGRSLAF
jgi:hypothetical protein